ncbi:hypothetical protein C7C45_15520 [Micromonospora arborensis]|uniref:Uncharacterized protein n=1 Tax=Micromonospora arborensis TaxID=2116518 RepID=A0A318NMA6_9ACTN|nr:hypothetical protein C7C45_15520 [Micromonospora arborensis]
MKAATQKVLDEPSIDAYLAYLNNGLYAARELECASQPTATPTSSPPTRRPRQRRRAVGRTLRGVPAAGPVEVPHQGSAVRAAEPPTRLIRCSMPST